jgi:hypothetical protein
MKYFKFLLINIVAFSSLFFLFSLLFPSQVVTSKTISINETKRAVIEKINNTGGWKTWNRFVKEGVVKNNTLNNSDTLLFSSVTNSSEIISNFVIYAEPTNSVLVNWAVIQKLPWYKPFKKFSAMILSKNVAAVMDTSLTNLKVQIEAGK